MAKYSVGARVRIVGGGEGIVTEVLTHLTPPSYRVCLSAFAAPLVSESDLESVDRVDSDLRLRRTEPARGRAAAAGR